MKILKKHWIKLIVIIILIALSIVIFIVDGFTAFLTSVLTSGLVGLCSSFVISYLFEKEKRKNRKLIKKITIENFVYFSADFLWNIEIGYKEFSSKEYAILKDPDLILNIINELKKNPVINHENLKKYKFLVFEYNCSLGPFFHSYISLNNQNLLLSEIFTTEEYLFFHQSFYNDNFKKFLEVQKDDPSAEKVDCAYIFSLLHMALNIAISATNLFPEIEEQYNHLKQSK